MNRSIVTIEWLAGHNDEYIETGERAVACNYQGDEITRGELIYTGGSGWTATARINEHEFTTWLVLPNKTIWIDADGHVIYIYRESAENARPE